MKKIQLAKIKSLNRVTLVIDAIVVALYTIFFALLITQIETPTSSADLEVPENVLKLSYSLLGRTFSAGDINLLITLMVVFMVIGYSTLIINTKHNMSMDYYDYHQWEAGNMVAKSVMSLATLNFVSFGLRIYIGHLLLMYSLDVSYVGFLKDYFEKRKEKKARDKVVDEDLADEDVALKAKIRKQTIFKIVRYSLTYLTLIFFAIFILIPFYWMILTSLKTYQESASNTPSFWVGLRDLQWVNIKFVIEQLDFGIYIRNTLIVAVFSTIGTVITTIFAAFAFARIEFKGRDALFSLLLMTMMIPGEIYIITNFLTVSKNGFGWIGTGSGDPIGYFATMIVPQLISVFYIFFLRQAFKQVPDSLYKAAKVDGCSDMKFLTRVMIPIAGPTIFTITILSMLGAWSAFIWPRLITSIEPGIGQNFWLISVALRESSFVIDRPGAALTMFNLQIAATAIVTVPLVIIFLLLRKYIMSGVGRSGTKG